MAKRPWAMRGRQREIAEAVRTSGSLRKAAAKLGVHVSTVSRLVKAGKVPGRPGPKPSPSPPASGAEPGSFSEWAHTVYALTEAEAELVALAQLARDIAHDGTQPAAVRIGAAGRFQAIVKQLQLPPEETHGDVEATAGRWPRPAGA
jgi:hypothetical protein